MKGRYDVIVVGGGPAGLSSAMAAAMDGASVLIVEREAQLGGILKQCVHDGFGLTRYGEVLTGPEYAERDVRAVRDLGVEEKLGTFVLEAERSDDGVRLTLSNREGIHHVSASSLVLATGCRERTARQVQIHGDRPSGVMTAGCAQNLVNLQGMCVGKRVVILGSGDIGLIMARRLTLEGSEVIGVYEARQKPSGLVRNVVQCLDDFGIPLHLSTTVTRTFGRGRLEAVEVCQVDERMRPVSGTEEIVACDTLVLSVGLIPENELAEQLGIEMCPMTKGPLVDQHYQTLAQGIFSAGNSLSVNDLVDYVSEGGERAGHAAATHALAANRRAKNLVRVEVGERLSSCVPQLIDLNGDLSKVVFFLRSDGDYQGGRVILRSGSREFASKRLRPVHQAETIRLEADLTELDGAMVAMLIGE
ncbi:MAG: FAD-dependent oxidoreductase [Atopobiaceae bacterium]|nr:FAD-dependent oxidoreductase [Atopobiaceae bacterium]MBR1830169.1 FAD-dependent oxidoreductase [Atopobiaceae bacterium]